jgi:hypothetical protein
MVRARTTRPVRRNRNAGPARSRKVSPPLPDIVQPLDEERYPNIAAHRANERAQIVRRARAAGMDRAQASRHADEHANGRSD